MKLYTDDREVPYKNTTINPLGSKSDIDGILAKYGIKKVAWNWDLEHNDVFCQFEISEIINNKEVSPVIRVEPPRIWTKGNRNRKEEINWEVSMRVMFWFIKSHLEMSYLLQSGKTIQFLPYIQVTEKKTLKDVILPKISQVVGDFQALEYTVIEPNQEAK